MDTTPKQKFSSYAYSAVHSGSRNPWRASFLHRFPWLGIGALVVALLSVAASVAILIESNGQPISKWTVQPTVYLAIASTITNITLHFALAECLNVAWWRRATKEGTKIADLHRYWSYGNSLFAAITSGRHINTIAIASILVAIGPINGPLLQRASHVIIRRSQQGVGMNVTIASTLPKEYYTAYLSGRTFDLSLLTPPFAKVVNAANVQADISITSTGCTGECSTSVEGAGFAINCSTDTAPFTLDPTLNNNGTLATTPYVMVFFSKIGWDDPANVGTMSLSVQYKNSHACEGLLQIRNCTMKYATVKYPVIVNSNHNNIELDPATTMFNDDVLQVHPIDPIEGKGSDGSTLGGFYKALSAKYDSSAGLLFSGAIGYTLNTEGSMVNTYAVPNPGEVGPPNDCQLAFNDPSQDIIKSVRDMMFRTAISVANESNSQSVLAQQTSSVPTFESSYLYLGLATLFTGFAWLAILPIFISWWRVGRRTSMSPIEIAKAFRAPILDNTDSNATTDILLREVGDRAVRYGAVAVAGMGLDRLEMSDPQTVKAPYGDQQFAG